MPGITCTGASRPTFSPGPKTLTFAAIDGVVHGDLLAIVVAYDPADSYTTPDGWTVAAHLVGTESIDVLVHAVAENEPPQVTLALALATHEWQGQVIALRSASPSLVIEATAIGNFAAATTADAPTVSTQQAISLELCVWSVSGATAPVPPGDFTAIDGYSSNLSSSRSFALAFEIANATGALPVRSAACNPATGSGVSIVLRDRTPIVPFVLYDPVPGNIGLRQDEYSNIVLRLGEKDGVQPRDEVGNLNDLITEVGAVAPLQVSSWTGFGRRFRQANTNGLVANDQESPDGNLHSLLQRDVTVQTIIAITLSGAAGPMTIIARGADDGSVDERYCYGLELQEQAAHPGCIEVRWFWQDTTGAVITEPAGVFAHAGDGNFFLLTATRRWESSSRVVTRYYVGGEQIAELVTADGSIDGGTTGHTTIGGRKAAGAWGRYLNADIDEIVVSSCEISGEEIHETHRRLSEHQPAGVAMFVGLMPPGAPWYDNPGNSIGRLVKIAGQALGTGIAEAERRRALWLPDAATLAKIGDWEDLCGLTAKPRDSLDTRRARVVAYLSRDNGFALAQVQSALAPTLDVSNPSQIDIIEFSNTISDDFSALAPERWTVGDPGAWSIVSGELEVAKTAGADIRWLPTRAQSFVRMALPATDGVLTAQIKLSTYWASLPVNTIVGLWLSNRRTRDSLWFGVKNIGGVHQLGYVSFVNGAQGAFVPLVNPLPDQSWWLRIATPSAGALVGDSGGHYNFQWSSTGPTTGFSSQLVSFGLPFGFRGGAEWVGAAAMSTDAALAANLQATFDDLLIRCPNGDRPFYWYAYRDPSLGGAPDIVGANSVARRIKPAHTFASAVQSKSVLCDDPINGLCDRGPMGAL